MPIYIYGLHCPVAETIRYVGKSTEPPKRLRHHICGATRGYYNHHTARWIKKLDGQGHRPTLIILHEVAAGEDWREIERRFIAEGPRRGWKLTNTTAGGEGLDYIDPEQDARYRDNLRSSLKKFAQTPRGKECAAIRAEANRVAWSDPVRAAKRAAKIKEAYASPEAKARLSQINTEIGARPEVKAAKSTASKACWEREEYRDAIVAARNNLDFVTAQSDRLRERWNDPASREKMNSARWTPEKRQQQADYNRQMQERLALDADYVARRNETLKLARAARWAKHRANKGATT